MVIYDSGDSSNLITALESNLSGAQQIFDRLSKGSQHLIGVIDSGTLSGAAYKAGQTLFVAYINPMLQKLNQAIADIQGDLKSYKSADNAISAVGDHLDSDQIQQLLKLTQNMIDLVEQKIKDDRDFINQFFSGGFEKVGNALAELPDLYDQLENLKEIKATRKKELKALETFSSSTSSLFQDSLRAFENAMKGVDVINRSTASSDGTITFPAGADMSWAKKLGAEKFSSDLSGKNQNDLLKEIESIKNSKESPFIKSEKIIKVYESYLLKSNKKAFDTYNDIRKKYGENWFKEQNQIIRDRAEENLSNELIKSRIDIKVFVREMADNIIEANGTKNSLNPLDYIYFINLVDTGQPLDLKTRAYSDDYNFSIWARKWHEDMTEDYLGNYLFGYFGQGFLMFDGEVLKLGAGAAQGWSDKDFDKWFNNLLKGGYGDNIEKNGIKDSDFIQDGIRDYLKKH